MTAENSCAALERLQTWYFSYCDGDWEHQYGFSLESTDNPGWCLVVDLNDTQQENQPFDGIQFEDASKTAWLNLKKDGAKLMGGCSSTQLNEMLNLVTEWLQPRPR